jgi:hypothetical protein
MDLTRNHALIDKHNNFLGSLPPRGSAFFFLISPMTRRLRETGSDRRALAIMYVYMHTYIFTKMWHSSDIWERR